MTCKCFKCSGSGLEYNDAHPREKCFARKCPACAGKGFIPPASVKCFKCRGSGLEYNDAHPREKCFASKCSACSGKGYIPPASIKCFKCRGCGLEFSDLHPHEKFFAHKCAACSGKGYLAGAAPSATSPTPSPVNIITGFHQTSVSAAAAILKAQRFQPGSGGIAGGGIYFALNAKDTNQKAQRHGVVLRARVDVGRSKIMTHFDPSLTGSRLADEGFDSVFLPTGDGVNLSANEYVVFDTRRITDIKRV
ncbi:hypothetical protein KIPB_007604 [Kipferlia bialata]|uniref:Uncharacterized protein n=1 Tax=Kipferlia bialata TaxID=797122 RepID=A0A9K3CYV2_9EUKA|nr:hypothetical protein KIPB_007604 [Kipferlia bialata]|eukprot:g7604.t1